MSALMISISGVRGIVGDSLDVTTALKMAAAYAETAIEGDILVASDGRTSGDSIRAACISGLNAMGRIAVDLGVATTPTTEMAVISRNAAGAIIVTASHNPHEWNGLKFLDSDGLFIRQNQLDRLIELWERDEIAWKSWESVAPTQRWDGASEAHIQAILDLDVVDVDACRKAGFQVVLDTINASGGVIAPMLLKQLGCVVEHINAEVNGEFARMPEPIPEHITDVGQVVRDSGAAVGLVLDPDGDRLALLDETGKPVGEEYTLALAIRSIRQRHPGGLVAVNVSTSRMVDDIAAELGFKVLRTPVGEINVVEGMLANGAELGGEGNGGIIYSPLHHGRDGLLGIALVLDLMAREQVPLSELIAKIPRYKIVKQKQAIDRARLADTLHEISELADKNGASLDTCDGVKLVWDDRWLHVRASNTEPVVRIITEAPTDAEAWELCELASGLMNRT
jgi:phosphomannomutase